MKIFNSFGCPQRAIPSGSYRVQCSAFNILVLVAVHAGAVVHLSDDVQIILNRSVKISAFILM